MLLACDSPSQKLTNYISHHQIKEKKTHKLHINFIKSYTIYYIYTSSARTYRIEHASRDKTKHYGIGLCWTCYTLSWDIFQALWKNMQRTLRTDLVYPYNGLIKNTRHKHANRPSKTQQLASKDGLGRTKSHIIPW